MQIKPCDVELAKIVLPSVIGMASALIVAFFTYLYAIQKLKQQTKEEVIKNKYNKILEAHQKAWGLLKYISDKENQYSAYSSIRDTTTGKDTFYLNKQNAQKFLVDYAEVILSGGHGLYLNSKIIQLFVECRGVFYSLLAKEHQNTDTRIEIKNPKLIKKVRKAYSDLILEIRNAISLQEERNIDF